MCFADIELFFPLTGIIWMLKSSLIICHAKTIYIFYNLNIFYVCGALILNWINLKRNIEIIDNPIIIVKLA